MASIQYLPDDPQQRFVRVTRSFHDEGVQAVYQLVGNQRVLAQAPVRPAPAIWEIAGGFYYKGSLNPVTETKVIEDHPGITGENKERALAWVKEFSATAEIPVETPRKEEPVYKAKSTLVPEPAHREAVPVAQGKGGNRQIVISDDRGLDALTRGKI